MLDVYWWPTENGKKLAILLEELGAAYQIIPINIRNGDQLAPAFLKLSPNGRMPALVDHEPMGGGAPIAIFESGAIMMYLAEKTARFWPQEPRKKYQVVQWVLWQCANQGPKFGEQGFFTRNNTPEHGDQSFGIKRFDDEVHRLYGVLNLGLYRKEFLAADEYTIADMICYSWTSTWEGRHIDIEEFPNVKLWLARIGARPAVQRAMSMRLDLLERNVNVEPVELARRKKLLWFQRAQKVPVEWD
jgi:GST-like protein